MRTHEIAPELVLCSTARRARETYERIEAALTHSSVRYEPGLYRATGDELLERLRAVPDDVGALMVIGHNPAIEELALTLARPSPARDELQSKFPTAALATLEFDGGWPELQPDGTTLVAFTRPRDLDH
jgi:phosphohistidine phosphatase